MSVIVDGVISISSAMAVIFVFNVAVMEVTNMVVMVVIVVIVLC